MIEACICLVIGVVAIFVTLEYGKKLNRLQKDGETVEGIVFDVSETDYKSNLVYPTIRFVTKEQEWITEKSNIGFEYNHYQQGDSVTIIYNTKNSKEFIIDSTTTNLLPTIFILVGIVFISIGIYLTIKYLGYIG